MAKDNSGSLMVAFVIGAPIVGWIADGFGPRWALAVGAASGFAAAACGALMLAGLGIVAETWLGAWLRAGLLASPGPRSRAAALGMAMAAPAFLNGVWSVLAR